MKKENVTVNWRAGLHARPASIIVRTANKFSSKIMVRKDSVEVDGKSVIGMMTLGAAYKTSLTLIVEGEDEEHAIKAIVAIFSEEIIE